ncbi:hypothetical protein NL676_002296 [Syzygium grande]|nr:hypothetical protein NL676_002296 [Syzygium grande]
MSKSKPSIGRLQFLMSHHASPVSSSPKIAVGTRNRTATSARSIKLQLATLAASNSSHKCLPWWRLWYIATTKLGTSIVKSAQCALDLYLSRKEKSVWCSTTATTRIVRSASRNDSTNVRIARFVGCHSGTDSAN